MIVMFMFYHYLKTLDNSTCVSILVLSITLEKVPPTSTQTQTHTHTHIPIPTQEFSLYLESMKGGQYNGTAELYCWPARLHKSVTATAFHPDAGSDNTCSVCVFESMFMCVCIYSTCCKYCMCVLSSPERHSSLVSQWSLSPALLSVCVCY